MGFYNNNKAIMVSNGAKGGCSILFNEYGDILSVEDVMEILGIGKNAAYELFRSGEIKCFRLKNRWKVPKQAIIDYINEKTNAN